MLINRNNNETNHVKFVSYTGRWPNLCRNRELLQYSLYAECDSYKEGCV